MPNADVMVVPLNRLTRLYDSVEQLEDLWVDDEGTVDEGEEAEVWEMDQDGHWVEGTADDEDEWESAEEDEDVIMEDAMDVDGVVSGGDWSPSTDTVIPPPHATTPIAVDAVPTPENSRPTSSTGRPLSPDVPKDVIEVDGEDETEEESDKPWKRFEVLPAAPADHAFYNTTPAQPSRNFMTRLTKEYKALQNSLPGTFLPTARLHKLGSRPRAWPKLSSPN